jgi:antitoxin ParD1/3/4
MNVSIPADLENFVHSLVVSGSYADPDEVVGEALLRFKRHEELRREIQVGIDQLDRGEFSEYDENSLEKFDADIKATENNLFGRESGKS